MLDLAKYINYDFSFATYLGATNDYKKTTKLQPRIITIKNNTHI